MLDTLRETRPGVPSPCRSSARVSTAAASSSSTQERSAAPASRGGLAGSVLAWAAGAGTRLRAAAGVPGADSMSSAVRCSWVLG